MSDSGGVPRTWDFIVIHCSDAAFPHDAWDIDRWHRAPPNEWTGGGYHGVISSDGFVQLAPGFPCRTLEQTGAHVRGLNRDALGICVCGAFDTMPPSAQSWDQAVWLAAQWCRAFDIDPEAVIGHREAQARLGHRVTKTCPGLAFDMRAFRKDVRNSVNGEPWFVQEYRTLYRHLDGNAEATAILNRIRPLLPDQYDGKE